MTGTTEGKWEKISLKIAFGLAIILSSIGFLALIASVDKMDIHIIIVSLMVLGVGLFVLYRSSQLYRQMTKGDSSQ